MAACVLDCSVALSWILPGEHDRETSKLLDLVTKEGAIAPEIWTLEVATVLLMAERRRGLTQAQRTTALLSFKALDIAIDRETSTIAWVAILDLAASQNLTVYDAAYLELSLRSGLPLATLDQALLRAASAVGVQTLGGAISPPKA